MPFNGLPLVEDGQGDLMYDFQNLKSNIVLGTSGNICARCLGLNSAKCTSLGSCPHRSPSPGRLACLETLSDGDSEEDFHTVSFRDESFLDMEKLKKEQLDSQDEMLDWVIESGISSSQVVPSRGDSQNQVSAAGTPLQMYVSELPRGGEEWSPAGSQGLRDSPGRLRRGFQQLADVQRVPEEEEEVFSSSQLSSGSQYSDDERFLDSCDSGDHVVPNWCIEE